MTVTQGVLVRSPQELTVPWAQRIVAALAPGTTVSALQVLSVEVGTTTRVRIALQHNGPATLPRRWFIKLPSQSWHAWLITALPQLLQTEVRFYQTVAPTLPVPCPQVLAAEDTTLVLADVTEQGARPGSAKDTLTATQATLVIEQLAHLHGRFWHPGRLDPSYRWLADPIRSWEDQLGTALAVPLMQRGLERAGRWIPKSLHRPALNYAHQRRQAMRFLAEGPLTLVHHDLHPGNIFWRSSQPGFLDWQLVRIGEGLGDIAYFLATALAPETRRQEELRLLARYQELLRERQVADLDSALLLQRYRAHLVYPFEAMVVTLAVGGMMELESNLELLRRAALAVQEQDAFTALARGYRRST